MDSSILITGESGTGKELVARTIHYNSSRAGKALSWPSTAAPSRKNFWRANSSATSKAPSPEPSPTRRGLCEVASGGTVFLDEVGEMSPGLQVKLLRFLQDHIFRRVGGTEDIEVDIRTIAATNKDPANSSGRGPFGRICTIA